MNFKTIALILTFLLTFSWSNDKLPSLSFETMDAKHVSLDQLQGKYSVIDFWATWCVTCRKVYPHLSKLRSEYSSEILNIVGMNTDKSIKKKKLKKYIKKHKIDYDIWLDSENKLAQSLELKAVPTLLFVSPEGTIITKMEGYDKKEEKRVLAHIRNTLRKN